MPSNYDDNVFINCPFDDSYAPMRDAIVFAIFDCGYVARCALEEDDGGRDRFEKINQIVRECRFGIHDISRTELDDENELPRFNMPLELGVFLGAKNFGDDGQRKKKCLIMDVERYRFQKFISDIAGSDIREHENDPHRAISVVRDWLNAASDSPLAGGREISRRYRSFVGSLPGLCDAVKIEREELTYIDYANFVVGWLRRKRIDAL